MKTITAEMWQKAISNEKYALKMLKRLTLDGDDGKPARVKAVQLDNGNQIPLSKVTPKQAIEFMQKLCPEWAKA